MMMPSIFGENLFDDFDSWFDAPVEKRFFGKKNPLYGKHAKNLMKTDVREKKDSYEVDIDLPGFKKDEIKLELENGYLTISAAKGLDKDEPELFNKIVKYRKILENPKGTHKKIALFAVGLGVLLSAGIVILNKTYKSKG